MCYGEEPVGCCDVEVLGGCRCCNDGVLCYFVGLAKVSLVRVRWSRLAGGILRFAMRLGLVDPRAGIIEEYSNWAGGREKIGVMAGAGNAVTCTATACVTGLLAFVLCCSPLGHRRLPLTTPQLLSTRRCARCAIMSFYS